MAYGGNDLRFFITTALTLLLVINPALSQNDNGTLSSIHQVAIQVLNEEGGDGEDLLAWVILNDELEPPQVRALLEDGALNGSGSRFASNLKTSLNLLDILPNGREPSCTLWLGAVIDSTSSPHAPGNVWFKTNALEVRRISDYYYKHICGFEENDINFIRSKDPFGVELYNLVALSSMTAVFPEYFGTGAPLTNGFLAGRVSQDAKKLCDFNDTADTYGPADRVLAVIINQAVYSGDLDSVVDGQKEEPYAGDPSLVGFLGIRIDEDPVLGWGFYTETAEHSRPISYALSHQIGWDPNNYANAGLCLICECSDIEGSSEYLERLATYYRVPILAIGRIDVNRHGVALFMPDHSILCLRLY